MSIWRVGFIGFGFIGKVHALAYRSLPFYYDEMPGEYRLAHVVTSRPETAALARERFGFERASCQWREVIDDPSIDIVHVAQPNVFHRDVLLAAMAQGKHIYCEKPLTATWVEAQDVARALPGYRGTAQMCLQNRFFPATQKAAALVREGFLGDTLCFRGSYLHSGAVDPTRPLNWKATAQLAGGGVINDLGPHVIDMLTLLCGSPAAVCAHTRLSFPERRVVAAGAGTDAPTAEDHAVALLRLDNGATGTVEMSKAATGTLDELRFEIHGTAGAMRFDLMRPNWLEVFAQDRADDGWRHLPTAGHYAQKGAVPGKAAVGWVRAHIACLHAFLSRVARGEPAEPDLAEGVRLQAVIEAAYRSARSGAWCPVPEAPLPAGKK